MIGALTALALSLPSYNFTGFSWPSGQFPIPYCISTNATRTALTQAQQRTLIVEAINYWRSSGAGGGLTCSNYDAAPAAYACTRTIDLGDGKNNIYFERAGWQWGSQTLGVTHSGGRGSCGSARDSTGQTVRLTCQGDPDIELNDTNSITWDDGGRRGNTDLASIVSHEYGHFIGLDHCNENGTCNQGQAVMYAAYVGGDFAVPRSDDAGGACALYPGTPGGVGYPCTTNNTCTSRLCVSPASGGYCTASCGTCPTGYACDTLAGFMGTICVRDDGLNRDACEECQGGIPGACAGNGICLGGIPEPNTGRCAIPCPNPAAMDGGCPNLFTCVGIQGAGDYCLPRSSDCTNLNNFTELQFGQTCTPGGQATCVAGTFCLSLDGRTGICSNACTGMGQGTCPATYACDDFTSARYCVPGANEGQSCTGLTACSVGPCLRTGAGPALCYKDCAGNASACNNAQMCTTYQLQGGGSTSICEPPGVPPRPPMPDAGPMSQPDATTDSGTAPAPDASSPCACDTSAACEAGCACDTNCGCACDVTLSCDLGCGCDPECVMPPNDAGTMMTPADATNVVPGVCACDKFQHCEAGCDCDAECPCTCDLTYNCDPNCTCDPECYGGTTTTPGSSCASTGSSGILGLMVLMGIAGWRRRR